MVRHVAVLSGIVMTLGLCGAAQAGCPQRPYPCPTPCTPNTATFGYFPTTWRLWPGDEQRIERVNPKAVGAQVIPTPAGQKETPLPQGATPQQPQPPTAAPEGEILPPGAAILPPTQPSLPQPPPAEPKSQQPSKAAPKSGQPAKPPVEGGLPGLPVEPTPGGLPGLPPNGLPKEDKATEQPKPKGTTMSPSRGRLQPATQGTGAGRAAPWDKQTQQAGAVVFRVHGEGEEQGRAAAAPLDTQATQRGTVISLLNHQESSPAPAAAPAAHRADSIGTASPTSATREIEPAAYATLGSSGAANANAHVPAVALDGYCPVELISNGRWTPGEVRYTVVHKGWIYRLSGSAQWRQFSANPDAFVPACSGNDPVLAADEHRAVPGQVAYCASYDGRLYMFASPTTRARFNQNPQRYVMGK
jgi:YHS domain-containing protein